MTDTVWTDVDRYLIEQLLPVVDVLEYARQSTARTSWPHYSTLQPAADHAPPVRLNGVLPPTAKKWNVVIPAKAGIHVPVPDGG
jgi:hypothetical protein